MILAINVLKCAAVSRLVLFVLQVFFNAVIADHDADAFRKPVPVAHNDLERILEFLFDGLSKWDGQYFLSVAEHGYAYEKMLAFFPLFPLLVRLLANTLLFPLQFVVSYHLTLLMAAVMLNFVCFVLAAVLLFFLCCELLSDEQWAYKAVLLFCYNPASMFFSAAYSEALFSCCVFAGMLLLEKEHPLGATAAFATSALVRSNGTVNAGFLLYAGAVLPIAIQRLRKGPLSLVPCCCNAILCIFQSLTVVGAFAVYQFFAFKTFCHITPASDSLAAIADHENILPGMDTPWCHSKIPVSYGYVQSRYWNVGFFRYFEVKQIPNFVLASPAVALCFHGIFRYAIRLLKAFGTNAVSALEKHLRILPYIVHCSFLLVFGITSMHVQVVTRLVVSSTPFFCLFAAAVLPDLPADKMANSNCRRPSKVASVNVRALVVEYAPLASYWSRRKHLMSRSKLVLLYFLFYYVIGIACFANFLPWT